MLGRLHLGIIGTAGPRGPRSKGWDKPWSAELFEGMVGRTEQWIETELSKSNPPLGWSHVTLVSGGAAWGDHVAVALHLKHPDSRLVLHLPCQWDVEQRQFHDNGQFSYTSNPGKLANQLHRQFSDVVATNYIWCYSTLHPQSNIPHWHSTAVADRPTTLSTVGFTLVTNTLPVWAAGDQPEARSGTADTWAQCSGRRYHFSLVDVHNSFST